MRARVTTPAALCAPVFALALTVSLNGCGGGATSPGDDAGGGGDDAGSADTGEFSTPSTCSSGSTWTRGDVGSSFMHPGLACIACHLGDRRAPNFGFAGTVYPTGHEPDDCDGVNGFDRDVHVIVTDALGNVQDVQMNDVGNFYSTATVALPITAELVYEGRTRAMTTPVTSGDCNACHTETGTDGAPGRLLVP